MGVLTGSGMVEILVEELQAVSFGHVDFAPYRKRHTSLDALAISAKAGGAAIVATNWARFEEGGEVVLLVRGAVVWFRMPEAGVEGKGPVW